MPLGTPKLARREQAIEAARRRLRRLEIEAHRIKADLARLEAEYEDDVADHLSRKLRRRPPEPPAVLPADESPVPSLPLLPRVDAPHPIAPPQLAPIRDKSETPAPRSTFSTSLASRPVAKTEPTAPNSAAPQPFGVVTHAVPQQNMTRPLVSKHLKRGAPPLVASLAVHAAMLLVAVSVTFTTIVRQMVPLFASPPEIDETVVEEFSEIKIEATKFDDDELQNVIATDATQFNVSDNLLRNFDPAQVGAGTQAFGDVGQLDALPSDIGTLMTGAGSPSSGAPGGEVGDAIFFGARSKGDRFVFVVDNSSSMKGGRLETATAELVRTVEALTPKQSFYVIFVSDQTYAMFYPTPAAGMVEATPENKKRLAEWLPHAMLASGKNREMIKAMDLAASMQPHAIYLLWDGDLRYSDKVRMDVMMHLTRPNQWNFIIHTLGMGVTSTDSEQNLAAIAQAHNGTYRRVPVPTLRSR